MQTSQAPTQTGIRFPFLLYLAAFFAIGLLLVQRYVQDYEQKQLATVVDRRDEQVSLLTSRLTQTTDVNELLNLGKELATRDELHLAIPTLLRAQTLAPESRDINFLLAWSYTKRAMANTDTRVADLASAKTTIQTSLKIDPINPAARDLAEQIDELQRAAKAEPR